MAASKPTQVFIVRHGERIDHIEPDYADTHGVTNDRLPLSAAGRRQAHITGAHIRSAVGEGAPLHVYSSPFLRCLETADELCDAARVDSYEVDDGLAEALMRSSFTQTPDYGFETEDFRRLHPRARISTEMTRAKFPERLMTVVNRFDQSARRLAAAHPGETVVLITHGMGIQVMVELDPKSTVKEVPFACITLMETNEDTSVWTAKTLTDASHWKDSGEDLGDGGAASCVAVISR